MTKVKIYDCFTFFNEVELLEARLSYLYDIVDNFVLVEAKKTHTGENKRLYFEENKARFSRFLHKIKYVLVDFPDDSTPWQNENIQRNSILQGLTDCKQSDIILISDLDEIPLKYKIPTKIRDGEVYHFIQDQYIYFANTYKEKHILWVGGTKAVKYNTISKNLLNETFVKYSDTFPEEINIGSTPTKIRLYRKTKIILNAGYHFTYLGGNQKIKQKLQAFAHTELIDSGNYTDELIDRYLMSGIDLLDPSQKLFGLARRSVPQELIKHLPIKFFHLEYLSQSRFSYELRRCFEMSSILIRNALRPCFIIMQQLIRRYLKL